MLADERARPAIVYCGTRKDTDALAARLREEGLVAVAYHAGMSAEDRRASQEAFMEDRAEVVVATNAFGMGVDKADVRTVAHWALPTSLEAYYQEAGRGGRDGLPARALLLGARMDLGRLIGFIKERETSVEDVKAYVGRLRRSADGEIAAVGHRELGERDRVLLSIAERSGAVELEPADYEGLLIRLTGQGSPRKALAAIRVARDRGWEAYRSIERYMTSGETCRRRQILDHFGDEEPGRPTGRCCDVCELDAALVAATNAPVKASRARRGAAGGAAPLARAAARPARPWIPRTSSACARGATRARRASRRSWSHRTLCSKRYCARRPRAPRRCWRFVASGWPSARRMASRCWPSCRRLRSPPASVPRSRAASSHRGWTPR